MINMEINYKKSWLWIFICVFMILWLGNDVVNSILILETPSPRTTNIIQYKTQPVGFSLVVLLKTLVVTGSFIYLLLVIKNEKKPHNKSFKSPAKGAGRDR